MDVLQREYDRFGPWVTVIESVEDIPQQFLRARDQIMNADFAFRIPLNVERRNVRKGMALYTTVVSFTDAKVTFYERTKWDFDVTEISWREIMYLQYGRNLLIGELLLVTPGHLHLLTFNPVVTEPVEQGVRFIRNKYLREQPYLDLDTIQEDTAEKSTLYQSLITEDFVDEKIRQIAYQTQLELGPLSSQMDTLQDALFLAGSREVIVITRDKQEKSANDPDYGYRYTYIPCTNITGITCEPDDRTAAVQNLSFHLGNSKVVFPVGHDFPVQRLKTLLNC